MPARQLWFWPPSRPLVERFGADFFQQLPAAPAVYVLCGPREGVLYVGKARNLRRRLAAYRVANPERLPRRLIRLLHQVTRIEWDLCPSEAAAAHREAELIAALNPRFNRAGTTRPDARHIRWLGHKLHLISSFAVLNLLLKLDEQNQLWAAYL